jgi:hypothetical protein
VNAARRIYGVLIFKIGHCQNQIRPQVVKTGQYPGAVLAELGHSVFQIRPFLEPKRKWGDRRIYETLSPVTSASASRWGRLFWPLGISKQATVERNDSEADGLDSSAPAMSGAETPTRCTAPATVGRSKL